MIINSLCRAQQTFYHREGITLPEKIESKPTPDDSRDGWLTFYGLSPRRTNTLIESAKRFTLVMNQFQIAGKDQLLAVSHDEKKKLHKFAYSLIASASPSDSVRQAFVAAGLCGNTPPQEDFEAEMIIAGTELALKNAHPIVIMRTMTAFLGFSVFDLVEKWLIENFNSDKNEDEELIIPGDLPDIVPGKNTSPGSISQAVRLAGPQLMAATLAGCPGQTIEYIKSLAYTPLGQILIDWDIRNARSKFSSEELTDAQNAFIELLTSFRTEPNPDMGSEAEEWLMDVDEGLVSDISNLILELDEHVLKSVVSAMNPKLAASLIQAMEPIAHDRLFSCIASSKSKKILDALENSVPLSNNELTRRAQIFAQKILSEIAPRNKTLGKSLPLPAKLRQLLTSILSRE